MEILASQASQAGHTECMHAILYKELTSESTARWYNTRIPPTSPSTLTSVAVKSRVTATRTAEALCAWYSFASAINDDVPREQKLRGLCRRGGGAEVCLVAVSRILRGNLVRLSTRAGALDLTTTSGKTTAVATTTTMDVASSP